MRAALKWAPTLALSVESTSSLERRRRYELLRRAAALAHEVWTESPAEDRDEAAQRYRDIADMEYEALRELGDSS